MGCVSSKHTPPRNIQRLKRNNKGNAKSGSAHKDYSRTQHSSTNKNLKVNLEEENEKKVSNDKERDSSSKVVNRNDDNKSHDDDVGNVSEENKKNIARHDQCVEGWPKWLVDNIPPNVLARLVPKTADSYEKLQKVGRGTYSNVYKARDKDTGKLVALKKVKFDTSDSESIKFMAREIMILQMLDHPNVIKLEGIATSRMQYSLYLVFEYMKSDLTRIISRPGVKLTEPQIKCFMQQLLLGLQHCHERGVIHRDIKPSNLLVDKKGVLKIADFGLANSLISNPEGPLTNRVVTLWYRAPELLLGSTDYRYEIDLWSVGCLLAEMFLGRPIMPGRTEVEQLHMIFKLCGSPSADYWIKMKLMTSFRPPQHYKANYEETFKDFPSSACALLTTLLDLHSDSRCTATSALASKFFKTSPLACDLSALPIIYKDEDERSQTKRRKRRKGMKNKGQVCLTNACNVSQSQKNQTAEQRKRDTELAKEKNVAQNIESENSMTWSLFMNERNMKRDSSSSLSISPVFLSNVRKSPKTEGHPNALKNVKNYTLLQASIIDMIKRNEGNEIGPLRKSVSALDFRLDPEKLSTIYVTNNKLARQM